MGKGCDDVKPRYISCWLASWGHSKKCVTKWVTENKQTFAHFLFKFFQSWFDEFPAIWGCLATSADLRHLLYVVFFFFTVNLFWKIDLFIKILLNLNTKLKCSVRLWILDTYDSNMNNNNHKCDAVDIFIVLDVNSSSISSVYFL